MSQQTAKIRHERRNSGSVEWYTPAWLLERVGAFYGGAVYDPCPASSGAVQVNGLALSWAGKRVYCNPPYGKHIQPWIRKAMTEPVRELLLLVPAYTDTQWFAPLYAHSILFIHGRVRFQDMAGNIGDRAPGPLVLVYRGRRQKAFAFAFADLGPIMRTYQPRTAKQPKLFA